jgi:hypothetical protein
MRYMGDGSEFPKLQKVLVDSEKINKELDEKSRRPAGYGIFLAEKSRHTA